MRFLKEYTILFIIIVFVILIEIITDNITHKAINNISQNIDELESVLETEEAKDSINKLCLSWKNEGKKLSYYMEHNELEKISILVDNVKSDIESENTEEINKELNEMKFLLEHVKNKQKLELKNIF